MNAQQSLRQRIYSQLQAPYAPTPTTALPTADSMAPRAGASRSAQAASPQFAPSAPRGTAPPTNPNMGQVHVFPNGRIGRYDGTGWEHIGGGPS